MAIGGLSISEERKMLGHTSCIFAMAHLVSCRFLALPGEIGYARHMVSVHLPTRVRLLL